MDEEYKALDEEYKALIMRLGARTNQIQRIIQEYQKEKKTNIRYCVLVSRHTIAITTVEYAEILHQNSSQREITDWNILLKGFDELIFSKGYLAKEIEKLKDRLDNLKRSYSYHWAVKERKKIERFFIELSGACFQDKKKHLPIYEE